VNKLILLLLLSLGFIGTSYADAICNDGWISKSSGSGTCSWHGGVKKWLNEKKSNDKYEEIYSPDTRCKGSYKERKLCKKQRFRFQEKINLSREQYLEYEKNRDDRTIEERLDDITNNRNINIDYRSDIEKELDKLVNDLYSN
jgi:hypothetical protein